MSEKISIGTVQFAVNADEDSHLLSEHPLGSISRLIAELLAQRLTYLGIDSGQAKLIVSKPEENTHKQLVYTSMLPVEILKRVLENQYFSYCLYGEMNFENGLKIEISLLDSQENSNLWHREINSKTYNLSVIVRRIIEEITKILKLDADIDKIKVLEKYSTDNLRAWGWYALAFEDDLESFDKETALIKAVEADPEFLEAKLKLISIWLGSDTARAKAMTTLTEMKDILSSDILNYFGLQMESREKYFEASVFYEFSLGADARPARTGNDILLKLVKLNFELKNTEKLNFYLEKYLEVTSETEIDYMQIPYFLFMAGNDLPSRKVKALELAKKAVEIYPESAKAYSVLAFIYMNERYFQDAAKAYERSFLLSANADILEDWSSVLLKLNDNQAVISIIEKYGTQSGKNYITYNSGIDCNLALAFLNTGQTNQAIKVLEKSVRKDKNNTRTNALLGKLYFENKSYARAQKYLLTASKLEPENYYWYKVLGDLFFDCGDPGEAIKYYNKATAIEPRLKIARYLCYEANNFKNEKNYNEAFLKYKLAAKTEPELVTPFREMGLLCLEAQDYDSAIDNFEKALNKDPGNSDLWFNLSKVYEIKSKGFFKGRWKIKAQEALEKYKELNELTPKSPL